MNCVYHRWRTKDYRKYRFCSLNKQVILNNCENCLFKQPRKNKPLNKKSKKLSKLERNRFSILTNDLKHCFTCQILRQREIPKDDLHEIYQGKNRIISIKNGFVAPICRECHENEEIKQWLKEYCQRIYEHNHTREDFKKLIEDDFLD